MIADRFISSLSGHTGGLVALEMKQLRRFVFELDLSNYLSVNSAPICFDGLRGEARNHLTDRF